MRRLLAAAVLAASFSAGTASAQPHCLTVSYDTDRAGVCWEYVCVDICAPEVHVDPVCDVDTNTGVDRFCALIDRVYVVVP